MKAILSLFLTTSLLLPVMQASALSRTGFPDGIRATTTRYAPVPTDPAYELSPEGDTETEIFGHWETDPDGRPCYAYTGDLPFTAEDPDGKRTELGEDPYFLLGNYRIGIIPHVSGIYECLTAVRGWARINASRERPDYAGVESGLTIEKKSYSLAGVFSIAGQSRSARRVFGEGFATWEYRFPENVYCSRTLSVRPSEEINGGFPLFSMDIVLRNDSKRRLRLTYTEAIPLNYVPMHMQMWRQRNPRYPVRCEGNGKMVTARFEATPDGFTLVPRSTESSHSDFYPLPWFMACADGYGQVLPLPDTLAYRAEIVLRPGESRTLCFIAGEKDAEEMDSRIQGFLKDSHASPFGRFSAQWRRQLPDFSEEKDEIFRREMSWNAHFVEASAKYIAYYQETFIPQGSVYSYHYGDNIAARDILQALLPACYTNPALARSALRYLLKHTHPNGQIERGDSGFGYVSPTIYQESDAQLYTFMAVAEYLRTTGDYAFLDEDVELAPAEYGRTDTVGGILYRCFLYLRDIVGTGPHGLVRLLNSDWSDSFLHRHSPNVTLHSAESHLNSAMALAVLPEFIHQIRAGGKTDLADAVEAYRCRILAGFLKEMENRSFSPRAYVAGHLYGGESVCIEPHSYLFGIPELSPERKREIYVRIYPSIADSWGLRTRETPLWGGSPEGEDGGIWFALEYPLLMGVSTFDRDEATRLLKMFSFNNFAHTHPNYWIGHWTAPDELNSSLSRDGLYAFWTGMQDCRLCFQGWCSHAHTWPLYCYYKLKELPGDKMWRPASERVTIW